MILSVNLLNIFYYDDFVTFWIKKLKPTDNGIRKVGITFILLSKYGTP